MKIPNLVLSKSALRAFRRRAYKTLPNEHFEALWGFQLNGAVHVVASIPVSQIATPDQVIMDAEELADLYEEAREASMQVVGSIHTHPVPTGDEPNAWVYPSITDHHMGVAWDELVMGITAVWVSKSGRSRSRTMWWVPQAPGQVTLI